MVRNPSKRNYRKYYQEYYSINLDKDFEIHHIDYDRENNNISNLVALPKKLHHKLHCNRNELIMYFNGSKIRLEELQTFGCHNNSATIIDAIIGFYQAIKESIYYMGKKEIRDIEISCKLKSKENTNVRTKKI